MASYLSNIQTNFFSLEVRFRYSNILTSLSSILLRQFWLNVSLLSIQRVQPEGSDEFVLVANLTATIDDYFIFLAFNFSRATRMYNKTVVFKLIAIKKLTINPTQSRVKIKVLNTKDANKDKFFYNSIVFSLKGIDQQSYYSQLELGYYLSVFGYPYTLDYRDNTNGDDCTMHFQLPKLSKIQTSVLRKAIQMTIEDIPVSVPATASKFYEQDNCV